MRPTIVPNIILLNPTVDDLRNVGLCMNTVYECIYFKYDSYVQRSIETHQYSYQVSALFGSLNCAQLSSLDLEKCKCTGRKLTYLRPIALRNDSM